MASGDIEDVAPSFGPPYVLLLDVHSYLQAEPGPITFVVAWDTRRVAASSTVSSLFWLDAPSGVTWVTADGSRGSATPDQVAVLPRELPHAAASMVSRDRFLDWVVGRIIDIVPGAEGPVVAVESTNLGRLSLTLDGTHGHVTRVTVPTTGQTLLETVRSRLVTDPEDNLFAPPPPR